MTHTCTTKGKTYPCSEDPKVVEEDGSVLNNLNLETAVRYDSICKKVYGSVKIIIHLVRITSRF